MEVTRKNYKEVLPLVEESIKKADFLTVDTEFTGLIKGRDVSIFDSPTEYYARLFNGASDFQLIQFGLCSFYYDEVKMQYMNEAYNFYVFPRRPGPERLFLCQSSSLEFLASQGFDFNKLIREGIPYMTEPMETKMRDVLTERQKNYDAEKDVITIPEQYKQQVDDICKRVRKFLDDKESQEMEIDRCNNFLRRLLFQELAKFKDEAFVETKVLDNQNRVLKVTRLKKGDDISNRTTLRKEKEWEDFDDAVGFSKVARMISQSDKLVVGHNMLLDVLHTLNHFFQPLPEDYVSFKNFAHCMFPRLLDTKYMSSLPPFKDKINSSVLQHLYASLSEEPFSLPKAGSEEGRGYKCADEKHHEAGFDAYMTGLCFLAMQAHVSRMRGEPAGRPAHSAALRPFLNKLFLAKTAHQDSPYMNLDGADPNPSRDHVFHMTFPKEWQRNDINQLFSPFGPVTVQFIDDVSAVVALTRREQARDMMRVLACHRSATLVPYAKYKPQGKVQSERRSQVSPVKQLLTPDAKHRKANANSLAHLETSTKVSRSRSISLTPPAPAPTSRKRTSSGVFQVDEAEPPLKKSEVPRSASESPQKKADSLSNGRRKTAEKADGDKDRHKEAVKQKETAQQKDTARHKDTVQKNETVQEKEIKKTVIEKFDSEATSKTVSAFKESDSWD